MKNESENQIQAGFFQWLSVHEKRHPELAMFHSVPNGANKSPQARGLFQRTGLKPGVPDVHLPVAGSPAHLGLWIEFKSHRGQLSANQKWWIDRLREQGHRVEICRGWAEAANVTIDYLGLPLKKL